MCYGKISKLNEKEKLAENEKQKKRTLNHNTKQTNVNQHKANKTS